MTAAGGEQLLREAGSAGRRGGDVVELLRRLRVLRLAEQEGRMTLNDGENIVEVVGNPARHASDDLHSLGLTRREFAPAALADIFSEDQLRRGPGISYVHGRDGHVHRRSIFAEM